MRSSIIAIAVAGLALAACTPKKEAAADAVPGAPAAETAGAAGEKAKPVDGEANITSPLKVTGGATFAVTWTGPGNSGDYIDIVTRGETKTSGEITYAYVRESNGSVSLRAPTAPGEYDVRYVLEGPAGRVVKVMAPLVVETGTASLTAPAAVEAGQAMEIAWTGPNGTGDYIDIVKAGQKEASGEITYAYTSAGNPAKLEAPGAAGDYEIRYVLEGPGGRKLPATSALKVTMPKAALTAPKTADKAKPFKVDWTGPRSSGDYVDLVRKGHVTTSGETDYFYVEKGNSGELTAPEAGEYEVRYILEAPGGRAVLAKAPVTVR